MGTELEPGVFLSSEEASLRRINYRATLNRAQRGRGRPSSKALLSKLWTIFKMANSPPRITARRGGRAIKKICAASAFCEDWVVFRSLGQGTPPRRRP